jgi:acyl-CoA thioester hydrolase
MSRPPAGRRADYVAFRPITTRWMDNDAYGHVNNVIYYAFFDTAVNQLMIEAGVLDVRSSTAIGLVIETQCRYAKSIAFPDRVTAGVRVANMGGSSVRFEIGLFANDDDEVAGEGHFVHVYVDRQTRRPTPIPPPTRAFLQTLVHP